MIVSRCTITLKMLLCNTWHRPNDDLAKSKVGDKLFKFVLHTYLYGRDKKITLYMNNSNSKKYIYKIFGLRGEEVLAALIFLVRTKKQISITKTKGIVYPSKRKISYLSKRKIEKREVC